MGLGDATRPIDNAEPSRAVALGIEYRHRGDAVMNTLSTAGNGTLAQLRGLFSN